MKYPNKFLEDLSITMSDKEKETRCRAMQILYIPFIRNEEIERDLAEAKEKGRAIAAKMDKEAANGADCPFAMKCATCGTVLVGGSICTYCTGQDNSE